MYRALDGTDLNVVGGRISGVGIAGFTLGGGEWSSGTTSEHRGLVPRCHWLTVAAAAAISRSHDLWNRGTTGANPPSTHSDSKSTWCGPTAHCCLHSSGLIFVCGPSLAAGVCLLKLKRGGSAGNTPSKLKRSDSVFGVISAVAARSRSLDRPTALRLSFHSHNAL